jgi:hypothetical protein
MGSRLFAAALAGAALCTTSRTLADNFLSHRSPLLVERRHTIAITMHPSHADLVVRRTAFNGGDRSDEATYYIDLPYGAVATGLRTLATLNGRPHWYDGDLLEAEAAAAKYRELTGIGGYYPKDPALLSWRSPSLVALQVFPCLPMEEKTVEYTLTIPTTYSDGARHIVLPRLGTEDVAPVITAMAAGNQRGLLVDGRPAGNRATITLPGADETGGGRDIAVIPQNPPLIDGELVTLPVGDRRIITQFAVRVAPKVAEVPRGAWLAIVADGSRSTSEDFGRAASAALDAYLSHFDATSRAELFVFDRKVTPRYGRFVPARDLRADIAGWEPTRANGSDVDAALLAATKALSKAPPGAARRILLLTDGHVRKELTPERVRGALSGGGAVAHAGILHDGQPSLTRIDDHEWASALRTTGGLVWDAAAGTDATEARTVFEEWARPVRLDHVRLFSPDLPLCESGIGCQPYEINESIDEGEGMERLFLAERKATWLRVEGELWAKRIDRTLREDPSQRRLWAAAVFGSPLLDELREDEMMPLAMFAGAVSPVTSYLAIEPGVRPSTDGLEQRLGGAHFAHAPSIRMGATSVTGSAPPLDRDAFLRDALASGWRRCGGKRGTASVTLETTFAEIVDVKTTGVGDPLLSSCLAEAAWSLVLPPAFDQDWSIWSTDV